MAGSYAAAVFVEVPVDDVVAAVLDAAVAAVCLQYPLSAGLLRRAAGDAVGELGGAFRGSFLDALTFDEEGLADVREIQVVVES